MFLDYHNLFDVSPVVKATRIVVYDKDSNPIALFVENPNSTIICYTAADNGFTEILRQYGINPPIVKKINIGA